MTRRPGDQRTGRRSAARSLALATVAALALAACASVDRPSVQADPVALPTPLRSFDAGMASVVGQLQEAVARAGQRLDVPVGAYRPSEPATLLALPRAILRADLVDTDAGYVVIYAAGGHDAAGLRARELADYLASGFGQTNFHPDTQFSVSIVGDTVVFTSWSRARSADPARAEAVFDAVASVGEAVEVRK